MLCLTRKPSERIFIDVPPGNGCRIIVTVNEILAHKVRLGLDAPRDCDIVREELTLWPQPAEAALSLEDDAE